MGWQIGHRHCDRRDSGEPVGGVSSGLVGVENMTQPAFDFATLPPVPSTPTLPSEMRPRLSRQNTAILTRLQQGPMTNRELAGIALKYTGRLSELRQAGYRVSVLSHDYVTGIVTYGLDS